MQSTLSKRAPLEDGHPVLVPAVISGVILLQLNYLKDENYLTRIKDIFEAIKGHLRRALCNHVVYFFVVLFQCAESGILECKLLRF